MAKSEGQNATVTFNSVEVGVSNFSFDTTINEIDTTDTKTSAGESEFIGGRYQRGFSFTVFKDADVADLTMNTAYTLSIAVVDASANTTTYSGSAILLTKNVTGSVDDAVTVEYSGRYTDAVTEVQTP